MKYLSVCSGIEAASVAWHGLGWSPVAFSEIEPFPCHVLTHRFGASRPVNMPEPDDVNIVSSGLFYIECIRQSLDQSVVVGLVAFRRLADVLSIRQERINAIIAVAELPEQGKVKNLGDMTKFEEWADGCICNGSRDNSIYCQTCGGLNVPIDLICGGTPCQSFSVAGLRKGLDDERGNLMLTFGHILAKYRPRWFIWENVPGVLSSDAGRDFASFLGLVTGQAIEPPADGWRNSGAISGIDSAYGIAYRVLDAQYTRSPNYPRAIPQRRRRVFVVGYFGDWRRAAAVLLDSEGVSRDSPPSRTAGQRVAGTLKGGSGERGYPDPSDGNGGGLVEVGFTQSSFGGYSEGGGTLCSSGGGLGGGSETLVTHVEILGGLQANQTPRTDGASPCLPSAMGEGGGHIPIIAHVFENHPQDSRVTEMEDVCSTVHSKYGTGGGNVPLVANWPVEVAPTLNAPFGDKQGLEDQHALNGAGLFVPVAFNCKDSGQDANDDVGLTLALPQREGKDGGGKGSLIFDEHSGTLATANDQTILHKTAVRRLLPLECERLQGFPDGWTDIPYRGKPNSPDGQRYKAIGNSMATNVMEWIGRRIQMVAELEGTDA